MGLLAVFGNPVAHSRSPYIHQLFARQEGRALEYRAILAPTDDFAGAWQAFRDEGGIGANVTVPFKTQAYALADYCTTRAQQAQAVNTLFWRDGMLLGDNTDGEGLIRDITTLQGFALQGKRILLLGAGGAARGVLAPLLQQQPHSLTLANRTLARAEALAAALPKQTMHVSALDALLPQYDVVINATSGSLHGAAVPLPPAVLGQAQLVYDLMYARTPTPFLQAALAAGCPQVADGLGMLVAQAAASYALWHGFAADVPSVVQALRADMARGA